MTEQQRVPGAPDEPDLLRDQFRQIIRYRALIVAGVLIGLLGGGYLALSGADKYVATSEVTVRSATTDPFAAGASADKAINIGSERQTALSNLVATSAVKILGGEPAQVPEYQQGLQVTNPPQTLVLRFAYTATGPGEAARRANAFTQAYLDNRQAQTKATIKNMISGLRTQLDPLVEQAKNVQQQIQRLGANNRAVDSLVAVQGQLLARTSELNTRISGLAALDPTPGYVIRTAVPPTAPSGPGLPMMLLLGAAVGVALGLLAAWVRLVFDPAARSDGDVVRAVQAPVLGTLPRGSRPSATMLADGQADVRLAEEYRAIAFRLQHDKRFAERRRLLVVAPRGSSDTAAAVSANLAASFAEMGMDVLLVEADLRTPGLAARLRAAGGAGIRPGWARNAVLGEGGWPAGVHVPVDAGESGSFDLVPGRRVRNIARALTSAPATRLIAEADTPGTVVIVFAPAVLAYADALALADRVDGVVVVCDPREVHRADLERVRELVTGAGGAILGAVLHTAPGRRGLRVRALGRGRGSGRRTAADPADPERTAAVLPSPAGSRSEAVRPEHSPVP